MVENWDLNQSNQSDLLGPLTSVGIQDTFMTLASVFILILFQTYINGFGYFLKM